MSRLRLLLPVALSLSLACASGGDVPPYLGPPSPEVAARPSVEPELERARSELEAATRADRKKARKHVAKAEAILLEALETDPHSGAAALALGEVFYLQGELGDEDSFERSVDILEQVADFDPDAERAALLMARAYDRLGDAQKTIYWAGYVESLTTQPAILDEMAALREPHQREFLSSWYDYGDYYQSGDARIKEFDPSSFKTKTVLEVTPDLERELGAQSLQQIADTLRTVQDDETETYLQRLVDELVAKSPGGPPFRYDVQLVDSDEVNALAFPGRILVHTGLLAFVENEAELVNILAHELAHVYAHHSARQMIGNYKRKAIASALLAQLDVEKDFHKSLLDLGTAVTLELIERGYDRAQEKEADRFGTHIAFNAGYNPTFMTSFFVRLYEANPEEPFKLLATHPPTTERIEYTTRYLEAFPLDVEMQIDSEAFQETRRKWLGR